MLRVAVFTLFIASRPRARRGYCSSKREKNALVTCWYVRGAWIKIARNVSYAHLTADARALPGCESSRQREILGVIRSRAMGETFLLSRGQHGHGPSGVFIARMYHNKRFTTVLRRTWGDLGNEYTELPTEVTLRSRKPFVHFKTLRWLLSVDQTRLYFLVVLPPKIQRGRGGGN